MVTVSLKRARVVLLFGTVQPIDLSSKVLVLPGRPLVLRCRANAPDLGGASVAELLVSSGSGCIRAIRKVLETRAGTWAYGKRQGDRGHRRGDVRDGPVREHSQL